MSIVTVGEVKGKPLRSFEFAEFGTAHSGAIREIEEQRIGNCILGYRASRTKLAKSKWKHCKGRLAEIEKLIKHRHGGVIPETDDAWAYAEVVSSLTFVEFGDEFVDIVKGWCGRWMPWAATTVVEELIYDRTKVRYSPLTADALGKALHLSYAERTALNIRTIGSYDVTKRQRNKIQKAARRERDRERKEVERRMSGAIPRQLFLANSYTSSKPWAAFGISRRTWERWGKPSFPTDPNPDFSANPRQDDFCRRSVPS